MAATETSILQVARWLKTAQRAIVFTGAGISTESGIPDFRSPGGVWSRNKPVYYADFLRSHESRLEYWRQKAEAAVDFERAQPNLGHQVIARWEQQGRVSAVVTQNIDGLHQLAGSQHVLELHGTVRWIECVDCEARFEPIRLVNWYREHNEIPACEKCGRQRLKSATVLFGQPLPPGVLEKAAALSEQSDVFLAIGSSLVVFPAAGLPLVASKHGAKLVIINRDQTDQDASADVVINEPIGQVLSQIDEALRLMD